MSQFLIGQKVKHLNSGKEYRIHMTPKEGLRIEATAEQAYMYSRVNEEGHREAWVRSAEEMEVPGKFVVIEAAPV